MKDEILSWRPDQPMIPLRDTVVVHQHQPNRASAVAPIIGSLENQWQRKLDMAHLRAVICPRVRPFRQPSLAHARKLGQGLHRFGMDITVANRASDAIQGHLRMPDIPYRPGLPSQRDNRPGRENVDGRLDDPASNDSLRGPP